MRNLLITRFFPFADDNLRAAEPQRSPLFSFTSFWNAQHNLKISSTFDFALLV
jgi:hypothetical protein